MNIVSQIFNFETKNLLIIEIIEKRSYKLYRINILDYYLKSCYLDENFIYN